MAELLTAKINCPTCGRSHEERGNFCPKCGRDLTSLLEGRSEDPLVGKVIAERYRILKLIGQGGMGVVYQIEHILMGKIMAMKLLHVSVQRRMHAEKRFRHEIKVVSRLSHIHTVMVFDCGATNDSSLFIVMEYLNGVDLEQLLLHEKVLPCWRAARIARQVCSSLVEAHDEGVIHRDIKPGNIFLLRDQGAQDFVKVLDFGIAKLMEPGQEMMTEAGLIIGTPFYMAPEQAMGSTKINDSADIYSLGVVLYEMVTGRLPFIGSTTSDYLEAHLYKIPEKPSAVTSEPIDEELEKIIMCALEKDSRDRFDSIGSMLVALDHYIENWQMQEREGRMSFTQNIPTSYSSISTSKDLSGSEKESHNKDAAKELKELEPQSKRNQAAALEFLAVQSSEIRKTAHFKRETEIEVGTALILEEKEIEKAVQTPPPQRMLPLTLLPPAIDLQPLPELLATRQDWERVENSWKRRQRGRSFIFYLILLSLIGGVGYSIWLNQALIWPKEIDLNKTYLSEKEPNDQITRGTPIPLNVWVTGELGSRMGKFSSDRDWFAFRIEKEQELVAIHLRPPKFIDVELGLYQLRESRDGSQIKQGSDELISVNNARRGGEEQISSYILRKGIYYILVRELVVQGESPQQFKGTYRVRILRKEEAAFQEKEPNNSLGNAMVLSLGRTYQGLHDQVGDIDFYFVSSSKRSKNRRLRYRIFYSIVGSVKPSLLILKPDGKPLPFRLRQRRRRVLIRKKVKGKQKRFYLSRLVWEFRFTTVGNFYLRIQSEGNANPTQPYSLLILR